jgi:hypothetical protein
LWKLIAKEFFEREVTTYFSTEVGGSGARLPKSSPMSTPVPQQSGQSSQVNMNLLSPPKKEVWPVPLQPGHGLFFSSPESFLLSGIMNTPSGGGKTG